MGERYIPQKGAERFRRFKPTFQSGQAEPHEKPQKPSPWEPVCSVPSADQRFVITYGGPYASKMEINRSAAERFVDVASLRGGVCVTDLSSNRNSNIEDVNSDGSVSLRRSVMGSFRLPLDKQGGDIEYSRLTNDDTGWRIEIAGNEILKDISQQESDQPLGERFEARFNEELRNELRRAIFAEKLGLQNLVQYFATFAPVVEASINKQYVNDLADIPVVGLWYVIANGMLAVVNDRNRRNTRSVLDYVMPPLGVDRYARGIAFTKQKGHDLVRITK